MRHKVGRRDFLKITAGAGGAALLGTSPACALLREKQTEAFRYPLNDPEHTLFTACLQCNTGCGIKVSVREGVAYKIDGNPLAPHTLFPHLDYQSAPSLYAGIDGALCPKGQAGLQTVYDPYRVLKVLKRAGRRGENKWISIPFEQAVDEIVNGGYLFKHVKGEEGRYVPGLKELFALKDPKVFKEMAKEVEELKHLAYEVNTGKKPKEDLAGAIKGFQEKFKPYLDTLINPNHPDLGPKNNQLAFVWGRLKDGRGDFIKRFMASFGSVNAHGHTTVCQGSLYFSGYAMSLKWEYDEKAEKVKWTKGDKFYWQADLANAEFVVFVGASPFEGNYGPPGRTPRITNGIAEGRLKIVVVDPRFSKTAAKAWKWLPIKPGYEGALAMAFIRYILENEKYDREFLAAANKAESLRINEACWTNATWLVRVEKHGYGKFLRAHEIGIARPKKKKSPEGKEYEYELFVAMKEGKPVPVDPNDEEHPVAGELFVDTVIQGIRVKSVLQIIKEEAFQRSFEEWCQLCELDPREVREVVKEFCAHGKKSVADIHRGVSQHTNGFYNALAWWTVNFLMGNLYHKGGLVSKSQWDISGSKSPHQPFDLKKMHPGKLSPFGVSLIRHGIKYEETTLFEGYPAKRNFYPLSSDIYEEVIPSLGDAYPYPIQCLILYMGTPVYSLPGGNELIKILRDPEKLPLFITNDITVGETSMFADYIIPDTPYLERWEFHDSHPGFVHKIRGVRNPVLPPLTESCKVFGKEMPICLESFLLAIAEKLGLGGFGPNGFGEGKDFLHFNDLYLKMVANIAAGEKPDQVVPDASPEEVRIFLEARKHLPKTIYDPEEWKKAVGEPWWNKVIYVMNRGGRYENYQDGYKGELVAHPKQQLFSLYVEKLATARSAFTGKYYPGYPSFIPPGLDVDEKPVEQEGKYHLITFREITMTKSRTVSNYWLLNVLPENYLLMHPRDARELGVKTGDLVRVTSRSSPQGKWDLGKGEDKPLLIKVKVTEGIKPGVVAFALGFGHFAYGSRDLVIDGKVIPGDPRRGKGAHLNPAMALSPYLKNTCLLDPVGGSVSFYDSRVQVERASAV